MDDRHIIKLLFDRVENTIDAMTDKFGRRLRDNTAGRLHHL